MTEKPKMWTLFLAKDASSTPWRGQKLLAHGNTLGIKQLAGQKTQAARPEGAEALSPWQRHGYKAISNAPCKGKSFKTRGNFLKLLPLQVGCVGQTFERGIWQQNHGSECDNHGSECNNHGSESNNHGSECDKRGSEKREKTAEKR